MSLHKLKMDGPNDECPPDDWWPQDWLKDRARFGQFKTKSEIYWLYQTGAVKIYKPPQNLYESLPRPVRVVMWFFFALYFGSGLIVPFFWKF